MIKILFNIFIPYFQIIRINNWIKNIIIFLPLLSSHNLSQNILLETSFVFFTFCISASSMYIINDYLDFEKDLLNNLKEKTDCFWKDFQK